jgi:hypothetical protein
MPLNTGLSSWEIITMIMFLVNLIEHLGRSDENKPGIPCDTERIGKLLFAVGG